MQEQIVPYMGAAAQISKNSLEELVDKLQVFEDGQWVAEEKLDGQWAAVYVRNGKVDRIVSRTGKEKPFQPLLSYVFPNLLEGVLIGEIGYGSSNPNLKDKWFVVYDFLGIRSCMGTWWGTEISTTGRRSVLEQHSYWWKDKVCLVDRRYKNFFNFYLEVLNRQGEGIMLKKVDTFYQPGCRIPEMIKVKKEVLVDMVVMGFEWRKAEEMSELTKSKGQAGCIKNILCGQYKDGNLVQEVAVGSMEDSTRMWFTQHHQEAIGKVIVVKGWGQFESGAIRHPSLYHDKDGAFLRSDIGEKDCVYGKVNLV